MADMDKFDLAFEFTEQWDDDGKPAGMAGFLGYATDIFDGSTVIEAKVAELVASAQDEIDRVQALGGAIAAVESGDPAAMAAGLRAAAGNGIVQITAGNYGGKLGKFHFHLHKLLDS